MQDSDPLPTEVARVARLRSLELLDTAAEEVFDTFTRLACSATGLPVALISLIDAERQWFKSAVGLPQAMQIGRAGSPCAQAIGQRGVFEVEDARADPRFCASPLVTGAPKLAHYAGAPLLLPGGAPA